MAHMSAQVITLEGGRYTIDFTTVPPSLIQNSTWYREFAKTGSESEECPVTEGTDVVVFTVMTPWSDGIHTVEPLGVALWQSWTALFRWLNFNVANIGPKHMLDPQCGGRLRELGVKVFAMPGGDTQWYAGFTECRDHIQEFIQGGGLYVGSCGGFGYLTSLSHKMKNSTEPVGDEFSTYLDVFPAAKGPVFDLGKLTPLEGQTPADVIKLPHGGPYVYPDAAVLAQLSDGAVGAYAGGFPPTEVTEDTEVLQRFSQVKGEPVAAVHLHGEGRNILAFVYHPEFELGLSLEDAFDLGVWVRMFLQPGDTHDLPMLQFKMWRYFAEKLLRAMAMAKLPVGPSVTIPDTLRYRSPKSGIMWKMVEGKPELVPEKPSLRQGQNIFRHSP